MGVHRRASFVCGWLPHAIGSRMPGWFSGRDAVTGSEAR
jgi:hypothetical protein